MPPPLDPPVPTPPPPVVSDVNLGDVYAAARRLQLSDVIRTGLWRHTTYRRGGVSVCDVIRAGPSRGAAGAGAGSPAGRGRQRVLNSGSVTDDRQWPAPADGGVLLIPATSSRQCPQTGLGVKVGEHDQMQIRWAY